MGTCQSSSAPLRDDAKPAAAAPFFTSSSSSYSLASSSTSASSSSFRNTTSPSSLRRVRREMSLRKADALANTMHLPWTAKERAEFQQLEDKAAQYSSQTSASVPAKQDLASASQLALCLRIECEAYEGQIALCARVAQRAVAVI